MFYSSSCPVVPRRAQRGSLQLISCSLTTKSSPRHVKQCAVRSVDDRGRSGLCGWPQVGPLYWALVLRGRWVREPQGGGPQRTGFQLRVGSSPWRVGRGAWWLPDVCGWCSEKGSWCTEGPGFCARLTTPCPPCCPWFLGKPALEQAGGCSSAELQLERSGTWSWEARARACLWGPHVAGAPCSPSTIGR